MLDAVPVASRAGPGSIARVAGLGILEVRAALDALQQAGLVEGSELGWRLARLER